MNILYIEHYAGGPRFGMEYRPYYLAREWVKAGHEVTIVAASFSHLRSLQPEIAGTFTGETIDGINFVWCRTPVYADNGVRRVINMFTFLGRVFQWRRWLRVKPDIVIASSTYPLDIYPARKIARRYGARLVWEVHDLWPLSPIELGSISPKHPFMRLLQRAEDTACRVADVIVSILPRADLHLVEHGMALEKYVHVPNGVDEDEWLSENRMPLPEAHKAAIEAARARGDLLVGYAGSHGPANSLETLLEAAELAKDLPVTWLLVGAGSSKASLAEQVRHRKLTNVLLLDALLKPAVPNFLEAMDVLYIGWHKQPLYRFGISPNKLMDYMMAGRPIIHGVEAANDAVADAGCGFTIEPQNPAALVTAVSKILELPAEARNELGQRGQAFARKNALLPVLAQRFLKAAE